MTQRTTATSGDVVHIWLEGFGYAVKHGPEIAPCESAAWKFLEGNA